MDRSPSHLDLLHLSRGDCVACVGGGGKTSILSVLTRELTDRGEHVVFTTTTKIHVPSEMPLVLLRHRADGSDEVGRLLDSHPAVAVGAGLSDIGKVLGLPVDQVCALRHLGVILVEADGSAGRSLKVHAPHEPVIPPCSSHVLAVAGVDGVGQPADEKTVHRLADLERRFGLRREDTITPWLVASVLMAAVSSAPSGARVVYLLNKVDSGDRVAAAEAVREHLERMAGDVAVLFTAHGIPSPAPSRP
jgi:probable selenium-dependent hydroxylase accessory protein YqeC